MREPRDIKNKRKVSSLNSREADKSSHQTGGSDFTEQEPKRDNEEAVLVRVHPDLKDQKTATLDLMVAMDPDKSIYSEKHTK